MSFHLNHLTRLSASESSVEFCQYLQPFAGNQNIYVATNFQTIFYLVLHQHSNVDISANGSMSSHNTVQAGSTVSLLTTVLIAR
jgi:hypothetical protein